MNNEERLFNSLAFEKEDIFSFPSLSIETEISKNIWNV